MKKIDWQKRAKVWQERAKRAERIAKAAVEVEHCFYKKGLTYTNTDAVHMASSRFERSMEELTWILRDTGGIKR